MIIIDHKYITTPEFKYLAGDFLNAKLAQANLITRTGFDAKCQVLTAKLRQINQNTYLLKVS